MARAALAWPMRLADLSMLDLLSAVSQEFSLRLDAAVASAWSSDSTVGWAVLDWLAGCRVKVLSCLIEAVGAVVVLLLLLLNWASSLLNRSVSAFSWSTTFLYASVAEL